MSANEKKKTSEESGIGTDLSKNEVETELIVPPDGGWGWVVVFAAFMSIVIVDGVVNSCGLLLKPMGDDFKASEAAMAFVSSLQSGFYLLAGPFVSALANRYGFRIITIFGSIMAAICIGLSYFAQNVFYMFAMYSILAGVGLSMIYILSVVIVGFYFERWRALATGIAMCGSGVGTFVFAPITTWILNNWGWRTVILIYAVLILSCVIFGALFRPLKPIKVAVTDENKGVNDTDKCTTMVTIQQKSGSGLVYTPIDIENKATPHTWMGVAPNDTYPTAEEVFRKSHTNLEMRRLSANATSIKPNATQGNGHQKSSKYMVVSVKENDENREEMGKNENIVPLLNEHTKVVGVEDGHDSRKEHNRSRRSTLTNEQVSRPMYREDIFFGGSLKKIPQYQSKTSIGYHLSVTHLPTVADVNEETEASCTICPEAVKRTLVTMLDFSLLKSPSFLLLGFSGFFSMLGFYAPLLYVTQRGIEENMDTSVTNLLVSVIGIANTIGRIVCGSISSIEGVNVLWINNIALTMGGVATMFSGLSYSAGYQYLYCVLFGLSIACFSSLRSIIVVDLMGLEKLTNSFGLLMMFQGLSAIIGAPIAGLCKDLSGTYDVSFYIAGGLYTFSAFLCYPLNIVSKWEKSKMAAK